MQPFFYFMPNKTLVLELSKHFQHQILSIPYEVMCEVLNQIHLYASGQIETFSQFYVCNRGKIWFVDINESDVKVFFK